MSRSWRNADTDATRRRPLRSGPVRLAASILALGSLAVAVEGQSALDVRVASSTDDAEESASGGVSRGSTDLELVLDGSDTQVVGIRFVGVNVPRGARILGAHVQFKVDETSSDATSLSIQGHAADNPPTFTSSSFSISSLPRTAALASWSPAPWTVVGEAGSSQRTPDLSAVLQEIVDRPGWSSGNALVLVITGSGRRVAEAYEGDPAGAPLLHVDYSASDPPTVTLTSPLDGASIEQGGPVVFSGTATDPEDGDLGALLAWTSSRDGSLGSGASFARSDLSAGVHEITASVTDSGGSSDGATVQIAVTMGGNTAPTVSIASPLAASTFVVGEPVVFSGTATDFQDGDLTANLAWSSSLDGPVGSGGSLSTTTLSLGTHNIVAAAVDSGGASGQAQVSVTISDTTPAVLVAAGDIADCASSGDEQTAALLDGLPGTVATLGDNVYESGTAAQFASCYEPSWGRHKGRTRPAVGNRDYLTPGAAGYFSYFGAAAGDPSKGYYSYDLGSWHVVVLNSECSEVGGCERSSPQGQWLQADLGANPSACTVAIWHRPLYSSSSGSTSDVKPLWEILYEAGAELVLSGHKHSYERFAPQDFEGNLDSVQGMRQFVVGTGGTGLSSYTTVAPNSVVRNAGAWGVLKLTLSPDSYAWQFVPVAGQSFTDSGTAACVAPSANARPSVAIAAPSDGSSFVQGTNVTFTGTASDAEDGTLSSSITWASSLNGVLGTGASLSSSTLSLGTHTITAAVTDSGGRPDSTAITVTIMPSNTPPTVSITAPANNSSFGQGATITFTGTATDAQDGSLTSGLAWSSSLNGPLGSGGSVSTSGLSVGSHTIRASVSDSGGLSGQSAIAVTIVPPGTVEVRIAAGTDDAEERVNASISLTNSDLELVNNTEGGVTGDQIVGLRFPALGIPYGATITGGWIQFQADETHSGATNLVLRAQAADNAAPFTKASGALSSRPKTAASVTWAPGPWTAGQAGANQRTPGIASLIQQVVSRPGWVAGNALALFVSGTGRRVAEPYEGTTAGAPLLHVEFTTGGPVNLAPSVSAGPDLVVNLPNLASLHATVADDGLPSPPGVLLTTWSQVSGPGTVSFADSSAVDTTAGFSTVGTYVVRLTANDGVLVASDDVTVTVYPEGVATAEARVSAGGDDAEEYVGGSVSRTSGDLELVSSSEGSATGNGTVGLRFAGVAVPPMATIVSAWVQLQADETHSEATTLTIHGQAATNPPSFSSTSFDISSRPRTSAAATWSPGAWGAVGEAGPNQRTSDLAAPIQEIVNQAGWASGNPLVLIFSGTGKRVAESFEGSATGAPLLHVEFRVP